MPPQVPVSQTTNSFSGWDCWSRNHLQIFLVEHSQSWQRGPKFSGALTTSLALLMENLAAAGGSLVCPKSYWPLGTMWTTSHLLSIVSSVAGVSRQWASHCHTWCPAIPDLAYSCRLRGPGTSSTNGRVRGLVFFHWTDWPECNMHQTDHKRNFPECKYNMCF